MTGWIKLHRCIKDNWLWEDKPFSKGQAWIDVLMMVNHGDKKIAFGNKLITVERGSRITSIRQLCDRWGWSNTKTKNFLKLLEKDNMIVVKSDSKKTTITIVNYSSYQDTSDSKNDAETTQERQPSDTETTQEHTNKNDKNDKNDKEDIYILTPDEKQFLDILAKIANYPLDRAKDLEMYKTLEERYPRLDLVEAIDQWRLYKLDKPLKKNSNPRSQINMAFKKYIEWSKCLKGGNEDGNTSRGSEKNTEKPRFDKSKFLYSG